MKQEKWTVIRSACVTQGAEGIPTYGVRCDAPDGVWTWPDVDTDPAVAGVLAARLNEVQPESCHYAEMVLDFIEERAGGNL